MQFSRKFYMKKSRSLYIIYMYIIYIYIIIYFIEKVDRF